MITRTNMPLFVVECSDVKALTKDQIDLLKCGDYLVKKDSSGEHAYKVTFKKEGVGMCLTYTDASVVETQSYDYVGGNWVYNSEDKTDLLSKTTLYKHILENGGYKIEIVNTSSAEVHIAVYSEVSSFVTAKVSATAGETISKKMIMTFVKTGAPLDQTYTIVYADGTQTSNIYSFLSSFSETSCSPL